MAFSRYENIDPGILRKIILSNSTSAINDYLWNRWKREDGPKIKVEIEINPDMVEYAFSKANNVQ